jgi:hypothetical protein
VRTGVKVIAVIGLIAGAWLLAGRQSDSGKPRPSLVTYSGLVLLGTAVGMSLDAVSHSTRLRIPGVWPKTAVQEIVEVLRQRGRESDEVLSGGVIWEFQSNRQPFARITHPLRFEFGIAPRDFDRLTERLRTTPPRFVVYDGYTERTHGRVLPILADVVRDRYQLVATAGEGEYAARLYEIREAASP